jgi:flagellar biosynthetic protein FlhB
MADEQDDSQKTEEPTQRKLEEAIKKGDVAKSIELNTFFILGGFTLAILIAGGHAVRETALSMRSFLMNAHQVPSSGMTMQWVSARGFGEAMLASGGIFGIVMVAALIGCLIQHRPLWTFEPMTPKLMTTMLPPPPPQQRHLQQFRLCRPKRVRLLRCPPAPPCPRANSARRAHP